MNENPDIPFFNISFEEAKKVSSRTRTRTSHSSTSHSRKLKRSGALGTNKRNRDEGGGWEWRQTMSKLKNYSLQTFISF